MGGCACTYVCLHATSNSYQTSSTSLIWSTTTTQNVQKTKKEEQDATAVYRSALRTLVAVVIAIFVPMQRDAEAAEAVAALQDHRVVEIVQTDRTRELLLQLLTGRSACSHFVSKMRLFFFIFYFFGFPGKAQHNTSATGSGGGSPPSPPRSFIYPVSHSVSTN